VLQLVKVPRDPAKPHGVLALEGPLAGKRLGMFLEPPDRPAWLRRNVAFLARGLLEKKKVLRVPVPGGLGLLPTKEAMERLLRHGFPDVDVQRLLAAVGCLSLVEAARLCQDDPEAFVRDASAAVGELASQVAGWLVQVMEDHDLAEVIRGLGEAGLDLPVALAAYDLLEHRARRRRKTVWRLIEEDPWVVAQVEGVEFPDVVPLARKLGKADFTVERALGRAFWVVWREARNGHAYARAGQVKAEIVRDRFGKTEGVPQAEWDRAHDILRQAQRRGEIAPGRGSLQLDFQYKDEMAADLARWHEERGLPADRGDLVLASQAVYLWGVFDSERAVAQKLVERRSAVPQPALVPGFFLQVALACAERGLDRWQRVAVERVAQHPIVVVTGAAGTGKTQLVAALAKAALTPAVNLPVTLLAPTAVAAQRAGLKAGVQGMTMHAGLGVTKPMEDHADPEGRRRPVRLEGLVLVDEAGMAGLVPFRHLLLALGEGARLVLVGDPAQLGAVGPGDVLGSLLLARDKGLLPAEWFVELKTFHRGSLLIQNADRIRRGDVSLAWQPDLFERVVVPCDAQGEAAPGAMRDALKGVLDRLASQGVPWEDVLVLCALKGEAGGREGVASYNLLLQERFNRDGRPVPGTRFRVGDRVVCVENDYGSDGAAWRHPGRPPVFNGMVGRVVSCDEAREEAVVEFPLPGADPVRAPYWFREMPRWLELAYVLTIHKAQGAEAPVVVVLEHRRGRKRFTRRMLYTAVTRALHDPAKPWSERVYLVGPDGFVEEAVRNEDPPRRGKLVYRMAELLAGRGRPWRGPGGVRVVR
jgi:hypothetical protein